MNLQEQLKGYKATLRQFIRDNWDDQRLHDVYAFNADGKMSFFSGCNCLLGVTLAQSLHKDMCDEFATSIRAGSMPVNHYTLAHQLHNATGAEIAYRSLGFLKEGHYSFLYTPEADLLRQRRLSPILRAEIKRRQRVWASQAHASRQAWLEKVLAPVRDIANEPVLHETFGPEPTR